MTDRLETDDELRSRLDSIVPYRAAYGYAGASLDQLARNWGHSRLTLSTPGEATLVVDRVFVNGAERIGIASISAPSAKRRVRLEGRTTRHSTVRFTDTLDRFQPIYIGYARCESALSSTHDWATILAKCPYITRLATGFEVDASVVITIMTPDCGLWLTDELVETSAPYEPGRSATVRVAVNSDRSGTCAHAMVASPDSISFECASCGVDMTNRIAFGLPAPHQRNRNRLLVSRAVASPPPRVLSRGQKQGATYERWTRALAGLLEQCNARAEPVAITQVGLLACEEEALRE